MTEQEFYSLYESDINFEQVLSINNEGYRIQMIDLKGDQIKTSDYELVKSISNQCKPTI